MGFLAGVAQLAILGYKVGINDFSDRCVGYLISKQNKSGGFYGSLGNGANYFKKEEIAWAAKYYLDAYYCKQQFAFNQSAAFFPHKIDINDERVKTIVEFFGDLDYKKVIDVGCGRGRYLRIIETEFPHAELYGLDISEEMLSNCPEKVITTQSSLLEIPFPNRYFDCVYCVETLEHSTRVDAAVKEMIRVLKPGGKIIIIDKNAEMLGEKKLEDWESWFNPKELADILSNNKINVTFHPLSSNKDKDPDGLFYSWKGIKVSLYYIIHKLVEFGIEPEIAACLMAY